MAARRIIVNEEKDAKTDDKRYSEDRDTRLKKKATNYKSHPPISRNKNIK